MAILVTDGHIPEECLNPSGFIANGSKDLPREGRLSHPNLGQTVGRGEGGQDAGVFGQPQVQFNARVKQAGPTELSKPFLDRSSNNGKQHINFQSKSFDFRFFTAICFFLKDKNVDVNLAF